jgi:hypothetical protein
MRPDQLEWKASRDRPGAEYAYRQIDRVLWYFLRWPDGTYSLQRTENCSCPLSQKPVQKRFAQKGGSLSAKVFLQKNFQVREKIPLSALAFGCSHTLVAKGFKYNALLAF